jgi:ABC-2 type transport system ATP-binding protein
MIEVRELTQTFRVHRKAPGFRSSVRSLFKRDWHEVHALKSVSLTVGAGEIVGIVGANGAGKTTLVKCLSGILHPTSGSATVLGHVPWKREDAFRSQIALIMGQKAQLWWDLPAADGFLLLREIYRIPEKQFRESLDELTAALQVEGQLTTQIRRLSLGERMKMELIAALLHSPRVVFLDEPTLGLDLTAQRAIREFLLRYREKHNPAMLLTSHYMEDIERLCRRIVIIRGGEIVYDGGLREVLDHYAPHKRLTVRWDAAGVAVPRDFLPAALGEITGTEPGVLHAKVPREKTAEAASWLLQRLPVADLNLEEEDVGSIIEALIRKPA